MSQNRSSSWCERPEWLNGANGSSFGGNGERAGLRGSANRDIGGSNGNGVKGANANGGKGGIGVDSVNVR